MTEVRSAEAQERFLARWTRRKAEAQAQQTGRETDRDGAEEVRAPAPAPPRKSDADMPPIESLGTGSDYAQFLSPNVSEDLRRLALRKLFHLPELNVTDGLDDYAEDVREFTPLGSVITADMRHRLEREAEEALAKAGREPGGERPAREARVVSGVPAPEAGAPAENVASKEERADEARADDGRSTTI